MHIHHSILTLAGINLHRIDFDPVTLTDADLHWLPHRAALDRAVTKRRAEHLAGRIAAFRALQAHGIDHIAGIGERRRPLWPAGWFGSISHCEGSALAAVAKSPVGVDIEKVMAAEQSREMASGIVDAGEQKVLEESGLPFPLALTLAFSAKESLYKALSHRIAHLPDFSAGKVEALGASALTLRLNAGFDPALAGAVYRLPWRQSDDRVITLASG
ncbi:enterobactin synthase subunit EntD [Pluralibacter gergoviae]|nr:enterobactin synthase subunit EntD [Pluralibacter gergoviae]ELK5592518.1 enterobactin synthase subunit EntD [Pluralibacter gergoviae]